MRRYISEQTTLAGMEAALVDWGLNYPFDEVWPLFQFWVASEYKVYPEAGGLLDQDKAMMDDFTTLLILKRWHEVPQNDAPKLGNDW
jgi:hypothetical protein